MMIRRVFLKRAAAVTILVAGGQVWRSFAQDTPEFGIGPAFEPWKTWRQDANRGLMALVRAAILSSNAYNTQPWLFKVTNSRIEIYADERRNLGAFDPYLREMHFSLGCALENLILASGATGYAANVTYFPGALTPVRSNLEPKLVVSVNLATDNSVDSELYDAIPHRHTNRSPFNALKPIPPEFIRSLEAVSAGTLDVKMFIFTPDLERKKIARLIETASTKFIANPEVSHSTERWFRTRDELQKFGDGVLAAPPQSSAASHSQPGAPQSYTEMMLTGRLFGLIAVRDRYDKPQTIRAGRVWQRAHLLATARGLAARPANGAVELIDLESRLSQPPQTADHLAVITGDSAWQPTFMFYMGYPTQPAAASARRRLEAVVIVKSGPRANY
jgi:nitroreductase